MEMLECIEIDIQLRTHKVNGTRYWVLVTARTGDQIVMIDLVDETRYRDTKPYGCVIISRLHLGITTL
jgi:hypothetical protein